VAELGEVAKARARARERPAAFIDERVVRGTSPRSKRGRERGAWSRQAHGTPANRRHGRGPVRTRWHATRARVQAPRWCLGCVRPGDHGCVTNVGRPGRR
jgi:hypothetical protein